MREDARVQHVRVRDHDVPGGADRAPRVVGGIAVVGRRPEVDAERLDEAVKLVHLIARQRLGREQVQRAGVPALEDGVDDREVVAEGLARGGGRDDDDVGPARDLAVRHRLVRIELPDAPPPEGIGQPRVQIGRELLIPRFYLGKRAPGGELRGKARPGAQGIEDLLKRHLPGSWCRRGPTQGCLERLFDFRAANSFGELSGEPPGAFWRSSPAVFWASR